MNSDTVIPTLNRLLARHNRSLAQYLRYASPTWHRGDGRAQATLELIVRDQQSTVERLGETIIELGGIVNHGSFPMTFTGYHDLAFDFLLTKLIEDQRRTITLIEQSLPALSQTTMARALAEESLGAAKGHLESLLELKQPVGPSRRDWEEETQPVDPSRRDAQGETQPVGPSRRDGQSDSAATQSAAH